MSTPRLKIARSSLTPGRGSCKRPRKTAYLSPGQQRRNALSAPSSGRPRGSIFYDFIFVGRLRWSESRMAGAGFGHAMLERALHFWRVFGAGISFSIVGAAGVLVFPVLNLVVWRRSWRRDLARQAIWLTFRGIVSIMRALRVIRVDRKSTRL